MRTCGSRVRDTGFLASDLAKEVAGWSVIKRLRVGEAPKKRFSVFYNVRKAMIKQQQAE
jgi:hypothetical protein